MKKLLLIVLILLLGAVALVYAGLTKANPPQTAVEAERSSAVTVAESESETSVAPETGEGQAADVRALLDELARALPELSSLQKEILLPQLSQWAEGGKAAPAWLLTKLEESGVLLKDFPGENLAEKLERFVDENRAAVLDWLSSLRKE